MIDNMCGFERMSFMDGFSRYNQIKMYPDDEKHTSFRTPLGLYCYTVMPFGLKNAGTTYQRGMNAIFHEHTRKNSGMLRRRYCSEKSYQRRSHSRSEDSIRYHAGTLIEDESHQILPGGSQLEILWVCCNIQRNHLNPDKVCVVQEMQPPKNL